MVPNPSGNTWQRSIMILARRNRAARVCGRASRIYVLARFLDVSRDVDNLSDRRINSETRTLAKRATWAGSSCNSNCVTIATSQPVAKLPVWGVVCCDQIRELNFKVSNSHKEGAFNLVQETNSCGFSRIAGPVGIGVTIGSSPFAFSPRIAQLEDPYFLFAAGDFVLWNESVGVLWYDSIGAIIAPSSHDVTLIIPTDCLCPDLIDR